MVWVWVLQSGCLGERGVGVPGGAREGGREQKGSGGVPYPQSSLRHVCCVLVGTHCRVHDLIHRLVLQRDLGRVDADFILCSEQFIARCYFLLPLLRHGGRRRGGAAFSPHRVNEGAC